MVIKKISEAIEGGFLIGASVLNKIEYLMKIPWKLLKEAHSFVRRNSLAVVAYSIDKKEPIHKCCENCLEAHLIKKAETMGLNDRTKEAIMKMFNCEIGHDGYYLDREKLIKI